MSGAVLVAVAAAIGNLLQGWDNATIAGAVLYIKKEFHLESEPAIEGLIVAMSLVGATLITMCSGPVSDLLGRRPLLIISSVLYFVSGLIMLWSPNVYVLLLARLLDGFGIGLAVTLIPVYISETAPSEIRGLLNTLPQFTGSGGMFLSYCMVFGMSLMEAPSWRLMLGVLFIPSIIYFLLTVFFLPESPRWLVSKGRMLEAKKVLQRLRGMEDVAANRMLVIAPTVHNCTMLPLMLFALQNTGWSKLNCLYHMCVSSYFSTVSTLEFEYSVMFGGNGELALLVEGLGVGADTSIEEYIIGPANDFTDDHDISADKDQIKLYGSEQGFSWVARPVSGQSTIGLASRRGSMANQNVPLMDPLPRHEEWDEESVDREGEDYASDADAGDSDDNLHSPLISRQTTSMDKDMVPPGNGSMANTRHGTLIPGNDGEPGGSTGIGGGWQLAWKWSEKEDQDGKEGGFKRIYLHQGGAPGSRRGSLVSLTGTDGHPDADYVQAAALVSQPALYPKELLNQHPVGPAMVHPSETVARGPSWRDLFEPGVKHALAVGVGLQILQQFAGINGVLYYTPQILQQAGVGVLLSNLGLSSASTSLLISALTTLLMLPCIAVAMRLMDISGRRTLLLTTIPVLIVSLILLVLGSLVDLGSVVNASISTVSVVLYFCFFVMGFGPVPNILCAEIFPTRVRGLCIAICALTFWICDIIVTYTLPVMLKSVGLAGVFGLYAVVCIISFVFVYLKVPETKGMPLEVISEFFAVGAKQVAAAKEN
ncbi:hypothetical protein POTOM_018083 [Populus tomentosa]|uniref:Major facilitator superfamily (MFS) profile domain-containing protein n=1 Tax=Populus tomentosa TaxID=118781 RepID=A0A8X7ZY91_POPTO|nr:hypothetical protein POTOM_018083 [Populus tomentosa]